MQDSKKKRKEEILIQIERIENVNKEVAVMKASFRGASKVSKLDYYSNIMEKSNTEELLKLKKELAELEKENI